MPTRLDRGLFLAGLAIYAAGQLVITLLGWEMQNQRPVDFAHWLLIIGVALLIPYAARLPRRGLQIIASPVLIAGIIAVIGMCMIDFVFWALPSGEVENEVASILMAEPSLWTVFMKIGPNEVFMTGLLLPALAFFRTARIGTALVVVSALGILFTPQMFNAGLYSVLTIGYWLCFDRLRAA